MNRTGKISLAAACVSAGAHLALLGGLAAVHYSRPAVSASAAGAVCLQSNIVPESKPLITEKPTIEPTPTPKPAEPSMPLLPAEQPQAQPVSRPQTVYAYSDSQVDFFGNRDIARSVCFVVDCSGSMYGRLGMIQRQLKECIASLQDSQFFYLIFFMDGNTLLESGDGILAAAAGQAKSQAFAMIDRARLGGQTNAGLALKRAMQLRDNQGRAVQLIYFMTDGFDLAENPNEPFYKSLMNSRKKAAPNVAINTIGFWASKADQQRLKLIAELTGGTFLNVE